MAGQLERLGPLEAVEPAEGPVRSSKKTEDLVTMVTKLQKEGSLEPQIEDLINRINELQQAKKSSEEVGEAQALWEALRRELDSLNAEKAHLEEVLNKKQEALWMLQLHCQEKEGEAQRLDVQGQLDDGMGQHKDLWEFHMLEERLAREIGALQSSQEQLQSEQSQVRAKLQEVEQRLRSPPEAQGLPAEDDGPRAELEKARLQLSAQAQRAREAGAGDREPCAPLASAHREEDLEPPGRPPRPMGPGAPYFLPRPAKK
ncbi:synaptonemal complex central element protein 1-like isoform X1 [Oryctolagus cuniculus]|uniref:synaptonemal complex central element protein 1-like isoform X1 n=1 Tax=Oryctolagus cuniculus TaxID=9986 RepID=UPI00387A6FC1